ncbi:hypothetical protein L6164_033231 [Bauhinia variegata]|uniref:Uncharacterized protein n=1 Tax=Bauhinia variegata TaxID=167791 RepID=A0ACB9KR91_BAUVA|nr:hypothetical protein L6164_033231 [Bauhinia variegata]
MKMRTTQLLALCLFLFAYRAASVLDTDGDQVLNAGGAYYLVPVSNSGSLGLAAIGNDSFPKSVVLDTSLAEGLPVRFGSPFLLPWVNNGMLVHIFFISIPEIPEWKVVAEFPIGWTVKVSKTPTSFMGPFALYPVKTGYKIVYYPAGSDTGYDIGIINTGGHNRLAVKDGDPFIFKIKKAFEPSIRMGKV